MWGVWLIVRRRVLASGESTNFVPCMLSIGGGLPCLSWIVKNVTLKLPEKENHTGRLRKEEPHLEKYCR
jgi:hypothetical protein